MGMLDLMKKARARQAAAALEAEKVFDERVLAAGLPPKILDDFKQGVPVSLRGWDLYQSVLEREGKLTSEEFETIRRG